MVNIPATTVKQLRGRTGLGMMDCKRALQEAEGDLAKAEELLRKKGLKVAELRSSRIASEGRVGQYIHVNGKIGVLVEINCETDFASGSDDFGQLLKDICMQVAATAPRFVGPEDIPEDVLQREKNIFAEQIKGKPEHIAEKITQGKLKDFYKQVCLLDQPFVKDTGKTVRELVSSLNAKLGENIVVRRFARFAVGEEA